EAARPRTRGSVIGREQVVDRLDQLAVADAESLVRRLQAELVATVGIPALIVEREPGEVRPELGPWLRHCQRCRPRRGGGGEMRRALIARDLAVDRRSFRSRDRLD